METKGQEESNQCSSVAQRLRGHENSDVPVSNGQLRGEHSTKAIACNSNSARLSATLSTRRLVHKIYNGISRFYKATFGAQANPNLAGLIPEVPLDCRLRKGYWLKVSLPNSYRTAASACVRACAVTHAPYKSEDSL